MVTKPLVLVDDLKEHVNSCVSFYEKNKDRIGLEFVRQKRAKLSCFVEAFHRECGTLTSSVEEKIQDLKNGFGPVLMTAHQPNLFAYGGVFRKATLSSVLEERLKEILNVPVVSFFGVADQDFTDDRWVKSALLPDVERRDGVFELRFDLPEKLMLNKVRKPSKQVLASWQSQIMIWLNRKLRSLERFSKCFGHKLSLKNSRLAGNFEDFWRIVEDAYTRAKNFSDFNAFVISKIVNEAWGYDTLFSRFSECQQIFEREFCFLLSHFQEYSKYVREITTYLSSSEGGVYEREYDTVPFWYHCDCGSKARLSTEPQSQSLFAHGKCLHCGKDYEINLGPKQDPKIHKILLRISARSLPMPLIFFDGLKVSCYVGGIAGREYLHQAKYVAEHMGLNFPPVVIWRPKDVYCGVGQLDALLTFRNLSGTLDFSHYQDVKRGLEDKIAQVKKSVEELELYKRDLANNVESKSGETIQKVKAASIKQNEIRREAKFSMLERNLKLLENAVAVTDLHPCIVDYAVNIGLKETSNQWVAFLNTNGNLSENLALKTDLASFQNLVLDLKNC